MNGPPDVLVASEDQRAQVLATLLLGFAADPLVRWLLPDAGSYVQRAAALFDAFGGPAIGAGTALITADVSGVACWLPPDVHPDQETMAGLLADLPEERLAEMAGVFQGMAAYHPDGPVWYLPLTAVEPARQGQGIGSQLLKQATRRFDDDGALAYLESSNPRNVSLYERHGFEVMGRIQCGSSPEVTPMLREPR